MTKAKTPDDAELAAKAVQDRYEIRVEGLIGDIHRMQARNNELSEQVQRLEWERAALEGRLDAAMYALVLFQAQIRAIQRKMSRGDFLAMAAAPDKNGQ